VKQKIGCFAWLLSSMTAGWCLPAVLALFIVPGRCGLAADEFQELVNQIPRSANAVVLLNMEKAKDSPLGVKEGWKEKVEKAFEAGLVRVPPQATRFVLASEIDFESKEPIWEAAVVDLDQNLSMAQIAQLRSGTPDTIEGLPAIARPNDTYLVQLAPKRVAAMGPGTRQMVMRWIREVRKPSPPPLSPYLQKAAVYSDKAGSEIIMALDLEGVMSFERVGKYLKAHQTSMDEWRANLTTTTDLLSNVQGVRVGVRIGEQPSGMIVVDLRGDASAIAPFAKPLLLQILSDAGALINDFESWNVQAKGSEISLAGKFSGSGLRRLLSVVDSPISSDVAVAEAPGVSPGELPATQAKKARDYFRTIMGMADDLKGDMKSARNLASTQMYFEKYAKRIERMPILGVDEELLKYSAYVANALRQSSMAVKTMGIQSGVRQASIIPSWDDYGYGVYVGGDRRVVRAEEKAIAATDIQRVRQEIIAATTDTRRKMTQKYQIEF
jgi:hypothetical protein